MDFTNRQQEHAFIQGYTKLREGGGSSLIKRGTYTIPFTFILPSSLPSSTQYPGQRGKDYNCRIQVRRVLVFVRYPEAISYSIWGEANLSSQVLQNSFL
jgi:Arrestin (or S-antigen), N-terminal domain